jgi:hypothetical protein
MRHKLQITTHGLSSFSQILDRPCLLPADQEIELSTAASKQPYHQLITYLSCLLIHAVFVHHWLDNLSRGR